MLVNARPLSSLGEPSTTTPLPLHLNSNTHLSDQTYRSLQLQLQQHPPPRKRLAPGLELRLRRLDEERRRRQELRNRRQSSIGRIPDEQIEELERLQRRDSIEVVRRGSAWTGPPVRVPASPVQVMPASGGVRLSGGAVWSETEHSMLESDVSSVISIGDRIELSDSDDELDDTNKYRMPDPGKTRLHLITKEPLSPLPRSVTAVAAMSPTARRRSLYDEPTTLRTLAPQNGLASPMASRTPNLGSPRRWSWNPNAGNETASDSDFASSGISRAGSIYSLSRVSLTGQLSQLTSMRLPEANSLVKRISSIPTSNKAAKALSDASEQIRMWISKAAEVLDGLSAEDDVEWAAAGGREGMEEVDKAIGRFEGLVEVYILSIERLQKRDDIATLSAEELTGSVRQMESIIGSWQRIKDTLRGIKEQVEIAMEWTELWNSVLGEIAQEMEGLNRLVFEMEEKRHQGAEGILGARDSIDLNELETIVEEQPGRAKNGLLQSSPIQPIDASDGKDDSSLLMLFARMQPLRASLDFLPMRLSSFHIRGNALFPTACLDLEGRRDQLEAQWKKLEGDAESLRRELGEDRWLLVFRNAGRQAMKMCESITRSYNKLREGIDSGEHQSNMLSLSKKIENYEAKKIHYGPAIERVLAIIDRGVLDRLTVNGEILRLQSDMKRWWTALQVDMKDMDLVLEDLSHDLKDKQLRDSVSTVLSERSKASSLVDTPGSSPASSIVGISRKSSFQGSRTPTPLISTKIRQSSFTSSRTTSRIPSSTSVPRRTPLTRASLSEMRSSPSPSPSTTTTPPSVSGVFPFRPEHIPDNRPRWAPIGKGQVSRDFAPLSKFEPSPYAKTPVTPKPYIPKSYSRHTPITPKSAPAAREAFSRNSSAPVLPSTLPRINLPAPVPSRKSSLPVPTTPSTRTSSAMGYRPASNLRTPSSLGRRSSMVPTPPQLSDGNDADTESPLVRVRPPSAMANGRRSSMLPLRSKSRLDDSTATATAAAAATAVAQVEKPRWR